MNTMARLTTALLIALTLALLTLASLSQAGPVQAAGPDAVAVKPPNPRAAGTTYYVNAVTGDDGRSLAEAQNPGTPWQTISHAAATVPAGVTGNPNTISVAAGTHDGLLGETFPITMSQAHISLVGAGAGSTTVDGGGTDDVLLIAAEGAHVEGFTFQNAAAAAIRSSVGGFTVTQNAFNAVERGVYVYVRVQHAGGTWSYGDMAVISNTFVVSRTAVDFDISLYIIFA